MTLIKSISGIRGTIGGLAGKSLSPLDVVRFTAAYATRAKEKHQNQKLKIVVGRDARISGTMVEKLVVGTLIGMGIDVIEIGLATTPTVEIAVVKEKASGGIIITASHNPKQWNALKLLDKNGEFLNETEGQLLYEIAKKDEYDFAKVDDLGKVIRVENYTRKHIEHILALHLVDVQAIKKADFSVVVDAVNSVGGIAVPEILKALGVKNVIELYCEPSGEFPHNPEPLPENLTAISELIKKEKADVGFVVDPDVDRLAIVNEDGSMFGEEYTLVACADYVLSNTSGNTVSNLSSTRALKDITEKHHGKYEASAVGEVNVVAKMKANKAVIGGEGNGGVIYPTNHYGRDALAGIALFLSHLAQSGKKASELRATYPNYFMSKNKIEIALGVDVNEVLSLMKEKYQKTQEVNDTDGVKIEFEKEWVHLRKSNTEPIVRIYAESTTKKNAEKLARKTIADIKNVMVDSTSKCPVFM